MVRENGTSRSLLEVGEARLTPVDRDRGLVVEGDALHHGGALIWHLTARLDESTFEGEVEWSDLPIDQALRWIPRELPITDPDAVRTSGRARLRLDDGPIVSGAVRASIAGLTVSAPKLAKHPVGDLESTIQGAFEIDPAAAVARFERGRIERRGLSAVVEAELNWADEGRRLSLQAELPESPCRHLVDAVPDDLLGEVAALDLDGEIAGRLSLFVDAADPDATELDIDVDDRCRFVGTPDWLDADRFRQPFVQSTLDRHGAIDHTFTTGPGTPHWTAIDEVSPFFLQAVLAHEDAGFFRHAGFAVYAMEASIENNLERGRFAYGASTLTMQLAKNLFLTREKTIARKAKEVFLTWWLERHFSKQEILELYVNIVQLGPELYGIRDGAAHYFGRHPGDLTPAEATYLATLLPAPVPRSEQLEEGLWRGTAQEIRFLLRHMERKNRLDAVARDHGLRQLEAFAFAVDGQPPTPVPCRMGRPGPLPIDVPSQTWSVDRTCTPAWRLFAAPGRKAAVVSGAVETDSMAVGIAHDRLAPEPALVDRPTLENETSRL